MSINPNYIPWMSLLGLLGAGVGFLVGGGNSNPEYMIPVLYGLCVGSVLGLGLRILLRIKAAKVPPKAPDR